jgi:hypothetical protein
MEDWVLEKRGEERKIPICERIELSFHEDLTFDVSEH